MTPKPHSSQWPLKLSLVGAPIFLDVSNKHACFSKHEDENGIVAMEQRIELGVLKKHLDVFSKTS